MDADGVVVIKTALETNSIDKQIKLLEDKLEGLVEEYQALEKAKPFEGQTNELIKLGKEIDGTRKQLSKLAATKEEMNQSGFANIQNSIDKVGDSVKNVTRKMSRWAMAVFGLRSAYMMVRNAISTIASNDQQLAADIEYIKNVLAYSLEPIVRTIVNLAKQLLAYVGYIIKAWTGYDIFANANKNLKSANKSAQELKRTMAGFDEMNVLQDNQSNSGGGAGAMPKMEDVPIPGWVEWIGKHGKEILAIFSGIAAALIAIKVGVKGIKALGIGIFVTGIVHAIQSLLAYLDDPSWENFGKIIEGVGIAVLGLALVFGSVPLAVAGAIALILGLLIHFWDDIKKFINNILQAIYDFGDNAMKFLSDKFGIFGVMLGNVVNTAVGVVTSAIEMILDVFDGLFTGVKDIFDGIITVFRDGLGKGLIQIGKGIVNTLIGILNGLIDGVNLILSPLRAAIVGIGFITGQDWSMDDIKIPRIPKLATGAIVNNPGQGVMMGNYIAGERGSEAVLPLDDFTMDRLGMAIARHMSINNDNKIYLNARQIARQMNITNNETDFAYNR